MYWARHDNLTSNNQKMGGCSGQLIYICQEMIIVKSYHMQSSHNVPASQLSDLHALMTQMEHHSKALPCFPEVVFLFDFPPNSGCEVRIRTRWGLSWVKLALKQKQRQPRHSGQVYLQEHPGETKRTQLRHSGPHFVICPKEVFHSFCFYPYYEP